MVSFPDDDLKRYKQELDMDGLSNPVLKALIARLEASENKSAFAKHEEQCPAPHKWMGSSCNCGLHEADYAWRKAAGK